MVIIITFACFDNFGVVQTDFKRLFIIFRHKLQHLPANGTREFFIEYFIYVYVRL